MTRISRNPGFNMKIHFLYIRVHIRFMTQLRALFPSVYRARSQELWGFLCYSLFQNFTKKCLVISVLGKI